MTNLHENKFLVAFALIIIVIFTMNMVKHGKPGFENFISRLRGCNVTGHNPYYYKSPYYPKITKSFTEQETANPLDHDQCKEDAFRKCYNGKLGKDEYHKCVKEMYATCTNDVKFVKNHGNMYS